MSGLYNMLFKTDPNAGVYLAMLGFTRDHTAMIPRIRDVFHYQGMLVIYARIGGGNRPDYHDQIEALRIWPGYIKDEDDSYDSTYALFFFEIPEQYKEVLAEAPNNEWTMLPAERWEKTLDAMKGGAKP